MTARRALDEGRLSEAIERQTAEVRSRPGDLAGRTFLFELLAYAGAWDRAGKQLEAIGHLLNDDPGAQVGAAVYRRLVEAETMRARLFSEGLRPRFVLEPPAEVSLHLEALDLIRAGKAAEARAFLDRAEADRTPIRGSLAGVSFDDFRDADDLLAPVLEVFAPAGYCWVPWEQIQYLEVLPPRSFRDLLWAPAKIASHDGQLGEVHLPAIYPGSHAHADETARLGRMTDWADPGDGIVRGAGLKTFLVGSEARTLFELTEVQFLPPGGLGGRDAEEEAV